MASAQDYVDLIAGAHRGKPKFEAMVAAVAGAFANQANVAEALPSDFDLDVAIGAQLDIVGEWVGISRRVNIPLADVYFAFDTNGLGFDQGVWKGPFDPDRGVTSLDDDTYRLLIRAKIGANHWDGTLKGSKAILDLIFQREAHVFIEDNQDMSLTIGLSGKPPSALFLAILTGGYIPIKPEGVRINYYIVTPSDGLLFGFDIDNQYIAGFDQGVWGAVYEN